ncbi:GyrI-like domain-containing protein [Mesorhizobium sp. PL10]
MYMKLGIISFVCLLSVIGVSHADNNVYSGPFFMCPDAHGDAQKQLFKIIDISRFPMRIDHLGQRRIDGFVASLAASRSAALAVAPEPTVDEKIGQQIQKLQQMAAPLGQDFDRRYVEVCFATTAPPADPNIDGPFYYMPGYIVQSAITAVLQPMDSVLIPEQLYLVVSYEGPTAEIGNLRYTMTEQFWQKTAPYLGYERSDGPNLQIFAPGLKGSEEQTKLELWTPIKPIKVWPR